MVDTPVKDGIASMPEQVQLHNPLGEDDDNDDDDSQKDAFNCPFRPRH
jgi:hypothetical protein